MRSKPIDAPGTPGAPVSAGLKACVPVMIGYFPVAVAFGIAGLAAGLQPLQVILISVFVYAGASQFLLLASIKAGTPWLWVVALCSLLNARHLLYGPLLARFLPESLRERLRIAFLLTDEVFATAFNRLGAVEPASRGRWITGLGLGAWATWIAGTAVGVYAGEGLERHYPVLSQVMRFALPALFLALVCQSMQPGMRRPVLAALVVGGALAAAAMAVITFLTRALPFMLSTRSCLLRRLSEEGSALAALGPSLLAGIAAAVIVPDLVGAQAVDGRGAYIGGLVVTAVAARLVGNSGAAVILGLAGYGLLLALGL